MKTQLPKIALMLFAMFISNFNGVYTQCSEFYGMTFAGGKYGAGTIFRTDGNGDNFSIAYDFFKYEGLHGSHLCQAVNGKLYGITPSELFHYGIPIDGTIFEWDPVENTYIKKFEFHGEESGYAPISLISANNGKLYGMTRNGGKHDAGVFFEFDPVTNIFTKKLDLGGQTYGGYPDRSLIQASNGKLYGTTSQGGMNDCGVLFEWDPITDNYTKKLDFNGLVNGQYPSGPLIQADNRKLYGTTSQGGMNNLGVLFEWDIITNTYKKIFDFDGEHGVGPSDFLVQACNGKIYGITNKGGIYGHNEPESGWITDGVLFEWDTVSNTLTKKFDFNKNEPTMYPASIIELGNCKLYGVTSGGDYDHSLLIEWDIVNSSYSVIKEIVGRKNGCFGSMMLASNGKIYGLGSGGVTESGVLYEWDSFTNVYTKKIDLMWAENGGNPQGSLIQARNGKIYGMTNLGGANNSGVLFEWNPVNATYIKKMDFNGAENGSYPYGSLLEAENGKLTGMTHQGGKNNCGVIFEWDPVTNIYTKKHDFEKPSGSMPYSTLIKANNGKFYGVTRYGGVFGGEGGGSGYGVLFEWDPINNTYTKKFDFNGAENGERPCGSLVLANNGKLYGMTNGGGANIRGVLFEWDPAICTFTKKLDFNGAENGSNPNGSLVLADNGKLYGMTSGGGGGGIGVIFEWDPSTSIYTKRMDFDYKFGAHPIGSLMRAHNGKYYGTTVSGGSSSGNGSLFEWDPVSNVCIKKKEFAIAERPLGDLIEISHYPSRTIFTQACESYTSPSGKYIWTNSGTYLDTLTNSVGCDSIIMVNLSIVNRTTNTISQTACESYTSPSGKVWTVSGEHKDTIPNAAGCDSIITVYLTIKSSSTSTISLVTCNKYTSPSGKLWTFSGEYKDTINNASGCDSIINVYLTIISVNTSVTQDMEILTANASEATYQWIDCENENTLIEGETQKTFAPEENGHYAVIVSQNGCIDTSSCFSVVKTGMVFSTFRNNIKIYPNPTDGFFIINLAKPYPNVVVTIADLYGRIIQIEDIDYAHFIKILLDTSPGIYMLIITYENERAIFKIVKN